MRALRGFEFFVAVLVLGVVICFCFELSKIHASVGEVFHGFVPSSTLVKSQAYAIRLSVCVNSTDIFQALSSLRYPGRYSHAP